MQLPILFNPLAGTSPKDPDALLRPLAKELRDRLVPTPFGPPWDFGPAIAQATQAGGPLLVWGGDGTLHHAAIALLDAGCPVPLGAIPGGSGNGLVRGLRTPLEAAGALQRLLEGRELRMDLPRLDGVPFLNLCGTGFEGAVAQRFEDLPGRGFSTYAKACWQLWQSWEETAVEWEAETAPLAQPAGRMARIRTAWRGPETPLPTRFWNLCIANLPTHGSGLWMAPGADPTDGLLHWAALSRPGWGDLLSEVPSLFREEGSTDLRRLGCVKKAVLSLARPLAWHLDGELLPARDRAELSVEPRAFRMQVTDGCPWI